MDTLAFVSNKLDDVLLDAELKDGRHVLFSGQARICSLADGQTFITALAPLTTDFPGPPQFPIGLYKPEGQLTFSAISTNGSQISCDIHLVRKAKFFVKTSYIQWEIYCNEIVVIQHSIAASTGPCVIMDGITEDIFSDSFRQAYLTGTTTLESSDRWLSVSIGDLEFRIKELKGESINGHWSEIRINGKYDASKIKETVEAFRRALCLRLGRNIQTWSIAWKDGDKHTVIWFPHHKMRPQNAQPLGPKISSEAKVVDAEFLQSAFSYFLADSSAEKLYQQLHKVWDTSTAPLKTRCLNVATAVEGLAKLILKKSPEFRKKAKEESVELTEDRKQSHKALQKSLLEFLESITHGQNQVVVDRFRKTLENAPMQDPSDDVLIAARLIGFQQLTGAELEINEVERWRKLRNKIAHGDELNSQAEMFENYIISVDIMNALAIGLIGWDGKVTPYGNWRLLEAAVPVSP